MTTHAAILTDTVRRYPAPALRMANIASSRSTAKEVAGPLEQQMLLMGATMSYARNAEIFGENEPADYLYKVVSGSVRTYKILSDGRRQIGGFYLPGDIFGLEFGDEPCVVGGGRHRHEGARGQAQRAQCAGRTRYFSRRAALRADRPRAAPRSGP